MPFWPDNIEAWFCYAEADFSEYGVIGTHARFLAVVKALPREFNRYVTLSMFTSDVSEPYETLKRSILKRGDLTDRQRLNQLRYYIELQGSATDMLQRMKEVVGQRTFDDSLFKQHFLSKLPQQMQAVLVSLHNNALDELAASADRILEITKSTTEVFSVKERPQTTQHDITELCHTLTRYLHFRNDRKRSHTPRRSTSRKGSVSRPRETDNPTGAGIIPSMESLPEIPENTAIFSTLIPSTRKTTQETSEQARVNG
uniref:Ty3 transposon capsid-like protein domain-containing protein n=1 Tax=Schistosoma curassoni TaxID=6186 RepID=A0A183KF31_9TREM